MRDVNSVGMGNPVPLCCSWRGGSVNKPEVEVENISLGGYF